MRLTRSSLIVVLSIALAAAFNAVTRVEAQHDGWLPQAPAAPVGSAFTYQGQLKRNGTAVNGVCDMQFALFGAASGGTAIGTQSRLGVSVTSGLFTIPDLDFGANAFTGDARWLEIAVKCTGDASFITLTPRQALNATPYALSLMPNATVNGLNNAGNLSFGSTTRQMLNLWGTQYGIGVQSSDTYFRTATGAGFAWFAGGSHSNAHYDPGGFLAQTLMTLDSSSLTVSRGGPTQMTLDSNGLTVNDKVSASINSASPAVAASNSGNGTGVYGRGSTGPGVVGQSDTEAGVVGNSNNSHGVVGTAILSNTYGVYGLNASTGSGVYGKSTGEGNGVTGISNGCPMPGPCNAGAGVYGENTAGGNGVVGNATFKGSGVEGTSANGSGVSGRSGTGNGVQGVSLNSTGSGVYGEHLWGGTGVAGRANGTGNGVLGDNPNPAGYAGYFNGNVSVAGTLSKSAGSFKIDHPLDPANKYLQHSFVESPDMMNVYNGNISTDAQGEATVTLPDYFEALNRDFRYQLTVIGQFAQAIVATEIQNNRFTIKTDKPFVKVSWQVTGIRHDPYANDHRIQVEVDKSPSERGLYFYPQGYDQPASRSIAANHGSPASTEIK